jgi:hypothetical protein
VSATGDVVGGRPLLVHGHPGHELRLFGWMEQHRPTVFLMTDGSGGGAIRTSHSREAVERAGAIAGPAFGLAPDAVWYAAILAADTMLFDAMVDTLVGTAIAQNAPLIVSDAVDGYNPMHDLCEAVAAAAVITLRRQGRAITHLVARAVAGGDPSDIAAELRLDREAQLRKQAAIDAHAPLAEEVRRLLAEEPTALATEHLRRPTFAWTADWSPGWERIGASRVAASKYTRRIEYARHVRPLALALLGAPLAADPLESGERVDCAS